MLEYRTLTSVPYNDIADCFNLAFSDYPMKMQLNEQKAERLFITSGVDKSLSFGAFCDKRMIGFIFNSLSDFNGENTAFNVAAGVVPAHRGNGVFSCLYGLCVRELKRKRAVKYCLEVLCNNPAAIDIYRQKGFTIKREFSVLIGPDAAAESEESADISSVSFRRFRLPRDGKCICLPPSFEHSSAVLDLNPDLYDVIFTGSDTNVSSYCIYDKSNGSILQLGFCRENRLEVLIRKLMKSYTRIVVKNVDKGYPAVLSAFHSLGFTTIAEQFEMENDMRTDMPKASSRP